MLVLRPAGLTVVRSVTLAAVAAATATVVDSHGSAWSVGALAWAGCTAVVSLQPGTALPFVNALAYPGERRFLLAPPAALLAGPIEVAWAATMGLLPATTLLFAARQWAWGTVVGLVGAPAVWVLARALHGLSRRWVVFVPAGIVIHDPLSLVEPVLFLRRAIERIGPVAAGGRGPDAAGGRGPVAAGGRGPDAAGWTQRCFGPHLELCLTEAQTVVRMTPGRRGGRSVAVTRIVFTPTRPGAVLAEAARRGLPPAAR